MSYVKKTISLLSISILLSHLSPWQPRCQPLPPSSSFLTPPPSDSETSHIWSIVYIPSCPQKWSIILFYIMFFMCKWGGRHLFVQRAGCRSVGADDVLQPPVELLHRVDGGGAAGCRRSCRLTNSVRRGGGGGGRSHVRLGRHQHLSCFHWCLHPQSSGRNRGTDLTYRFNTDAKSDIFTVI